MTITTDIAHDELRRLRHKACGFQLNKVSRKREWWLLCVVCGPKYSWKIADILQGKVTDLITVD